MGELGGLERVGPELVLKAIGYTAVFGSRGTEYDSVGEMDFYGNLVANRPMDGAALF